MSKIEDYFISVEEIEENEEEAGETFVFDKESLTLPEDFTFEELKEASSGDVRFITFPTLYNLSLHDKVIQWTVYFDKEEMQIFTVYGQVGGKLQKSEVTQVKELKIKRDILETAKIAIKRKIENQKVNKGYRNKPNFDSNIPVRGKPMLTQKIENFGLKIVKEILTQHPNISSKQFKNICLGYLPEADISDPESLMREIAAFKLKSIFPVYTQVKIDGVRTLVFHHQLDKKLHYVSRQNKPYRYLPKYFDQELERFIYFLNILAPDVELDGEMWIPDYELNQITSIIQSNINENQELDKLIYNIFDYDCSEKHPYDIRYQNLKTAYNSYVKNHGEPTKFKILESELVHSYQEIWEKHQSYTEQGYEGVIVRKSALTKTGEIDMNKALYVHGRSSNLLKFTSWLSEEAEIVEVLKGKKGKGENLAVVKVKNPFYDPNNPDHKNSEYFKVTPQETQEVRKHWLEHPEEIIGKMYTFEYKNISPYGVPLKAKGKVIRDYE